MYKNFLKRYFDFLLAFISISLLMPFFIVITVFLFFVNQGKPFFIQKKPGYKSHIFSIIKFKTLNDKKDENGLLLPDAERMTKVGNFVRKTSFNSINFHCYFRGKLSIIRSDE